MRHHHYVFSDAEVLVLTPVMRCRGMNAVPLATIWNEIWSRSCFARHERNEVVNRRRNNSVILAEHGPRGLSSTYEGPHEHDQLTQQVISLWTMPYITYTHLSSTDPTEHVRWWKVRYMNIAGCYRHGRRPTWR